MPAHTQNIPIPLPLDGLNTEKNDLHSPPKPQNAPQQKASTLRKNTPPPQMRQGRNLSSGASAPAFDDYFLAFGARIMFIFLPSSLGISSTLANSSKSVAKRSSRISPCSLKTIERPRKKT